jgi:glycosyltransferase involved in cell wall biosynthesis
MNSPSSNKQWQSGSAPVAVVMIALNEGHNMEEVLQNLKGWAQEVFLVDSYSQDDTVDIALQHGVHVVQRRFLGFGDQWNFALRELPITAAWTMKLDPDERLSGELKNNIITAIKKANIDGLTFFRRWWFMGRRLPIQDKVLRVWRTGQCAFSDVSVNEHPVVGGRVKFVHGDMEHLDSPDLEHWLEKQNCYSTAEAINAYDGASLATVPRLFGSSMQRRMWLKKYYHKIPFRHLLLFFYFWLWRGTWRAGWVGYVSARLWVDVFRLIEYKRREIEIRGRLPIKRHYGPGQTDKRVRQFHSE